MRLLGIALLLLAVLLPTPAYAQGCVARAARLDDMVGHYGTGSPRGPKIDIDRCGWVSVGWEDATMNQNASYLASDRIPTGGFMAYAAFDNVPSLDDARFILVKPAEPGYIQLWTLDTLGNVISIYRLASTT